ncbi:MULTISPECIES: cytochrome b [Ralstonia solanacearum species complex]|uniref:Cytochrome B561 n=2 Tax=Ralstonia solanacearum species complex TaxID=3116862 RepID=A0A0S4VNR1_RALSL|nr:MULTISPECIES: cytochrome b [Ralstonia]ANH32029.1 Cytochrome B561 [Ralstonia solanacearum]AGH85153.1 Cytochrome B561 [Ralstonia pseudosolanacearum FQY_4]ASL74005.1 cytochrome b [Ralstonia pseudosolanacearum]AXV73108.1 cytochrome b [Ralstonia solanacearum]AXW14232.1 cytochrome b [Ralstonia solanacearum]
MPHAARSDAALRAPAADDGAYGKPAIALHWIIALLIFAAFGLGLYMTDIPGFTPTKLKLYSYHKWAGITVLILAVLRVLWRLTHPAPAPVAGMPAWQQKAAEGAHIVLYLLILAVPLTGYLLSVAAGIKVVYLGLWELPMPFDKSDALKEIFQVAHEWLNWTMATIVVLHILAALKHHIVDRDGTLRRMLPFLR